MAEISREFWQMLLNINAALVPLEECVDGQSVTKMPNSAFATECRVPENAE
jgi:hypothetical protein